jgi:hypothetical protein
MQSSGLRSQNPIILPGNGFCSALKEKGGKEKELPVHHKLEEILDQYLKATGLEKEPGSPLFPAAWGKDRVIAQAACAH